MTDLKHKLQVINWIELGVNRKRHILYGRRCNSRGGQLKANENGLGPERQFISQ